LLLLAGGHHASAATAGVKRAHPAGPTSSAYAPGVLLSTTDPEQWVGLRVQVSSGRHAGQVGTVVSSGNGWVQIETPVGEVAKRSYELQIAADGATSSLSGDGRHGKRARTSKGGRGDDNSVGEPQGRLMLNLDGVDSYSADDNTGNLLLNLSHSGLQRRPRSYSDSLMSLSPSLLGNGNYFTFRTGMPGSSASSGASAAAASALLSSIPEAREERERGESSSGLRHQPFLHSHRPAHKPSESSKALIRNTAFVDARKSFVTKYVQRHSAKIANRPNLVDWKQQLEATLVTDALFERQAARMFEESHCEVCGVDRWPGARFCWNESCPISPVYFKLTGTNGKSLDSTSASTRDGSLPSTPGRGSSGHNGALHTQVTPSTRGILPNPDNDYLLGLPARLVGAPSERAYNTEALSAQSALPPRARFESSDRPLVREDGHPLDMALHHITGGPDNRGVAYTQYYHHRDSRSNSFAGGETDSELPNSPITA
jgi:hypothetical protein